MVKISIPYGTIEGQTAKIADYIADVIRHQGHEAEPVDIRHVRDGVSGCDGVIVGGDRNQRHRTSSVSTASSPSSPTWRGGRDEAHRPGSASGALGESRWRRPPRRQRSWVCVDVTT